MLYYAQLYPQVRTYFAAISSRAKTMQGKSVSSMMAKTKPDNALNWTINDKQAWICTTFLAESQITPNEFRIAVSIRLKFGHI